ncbi:hypothetical protein OH805_11660 [Streptomyces sp. NBC_00879]|uniref:hypothetical protein n=1 Tax=Streptomyces sp. NBC_00879 TaxID=2975855 RepID=UPI00386E4F6D|nr:hypothetical protein OH805_11660 [Streptomyces sp. NBC_00879]
MSDEQATPQATELPIIPAAEVNPEDVGTLSLRYVDGVPQLVVSGGTVVPTGLTVLDSSGNVVALYTAGAAPKAVRSSGLYTADMTVIFDAVPRP